ncbi:MAG: hypothetical protein VKL59_18825 [Nostocaceae cyanobacterium]|nr:hypothetical protein [Nostocaceae cyanobacterium]
MACRSHSLGGNALGKLCFQNSEAEPRLMHYQSETGNEGNEGNEGTTGNEGK